ncbi:MAG: RluA family pseudouridine synthase [Clostridia bacterium]|nr:RluA family pseudouridine synthase [Clostridia bacterium]
MEIEIDEKYDGITVLQILKKELHLSSKMISSLKRRDNGITVSGKHVTVRKTVSYGDILSIEVEDTEDNENLVKTEMPLDIIYEDDEIILVNKPPMLPTHPSHGHFDDTLANGVAFHMRNQPFVFRAVNRLDRNTSGLVLIAKNRLSASRLYSSMQKGDICKEYIALLCGVPCERDGRIDTYIRRKEASIITREVCGKLSDSSRAITDYSTLVHNGKISVVSAKPITGRTHQLRLHFAYIGTPIIGDDLYGTTDTEFNINRQALHAVRLTFPHPITKEKMVFSAPIPLDMKEIIIKNDLKIEV